MAAHTETPERRILTLDATRGAAVMGILLINIISFSMPQSAYINPIAWGGTSTADLTIWAVNQLLFEGRMRGLFALLFGASALMVMVRAERSGRGPVATHLARMAVLALLGTAHMVLVWDGDVLLHYAIVSLLIWPLRNLPAHKLAALAVIVLALSTLYWSATFVLQSRIVAAAQQPGAAATLVERAHHILTFAPGPGDPSIASDLALYRGNYAGIVAHHWAEVIALPLQFLTLMGAETLGYMLLGMALFRSGLFTGGWSDEAIRRLMVMSYVVSLPVLAGLTAWDIASGFDRIQLLGHFLGWSIPFRVACAVGHLCLAVLVVSRFGASAAVTRVAAVGRMALSNYLSTSVAMTTVFYGYGLGLFGLLSRAQVYAVVLAMWALMLLWSKPWLARFRYGPAEWLWRSAARARFQPFRGTSG